MQSMGRSTDWKLEDDMVDSLFCARDQVTICKASLMVGSIRRV